jgi:two-component system NtrC family sensor kinase
MYQLEHFDVGDLVECSNELRSLGDGAEDMEEVARRSVDYLYRSLVAGESGPACALVRFYKTHPLGRLTPDLQDFARRLHGAVLDDDVRCLTLLASAGADPAWNDRRKSEGHQAIPLAGTTFLDQSPMIASLVSGFGIDADFVVRPNPAEIIERHHQDYGVFHVERALGSNAVPAQDFVERYGIESVVGIGGVLPSGDLFAIVLFATVPVSADVADLIRSLGLAVKAAIVRYTFTVFSAAD